ncbi:hypothetical protein LJC63_02660 [Ruminococcaceae bacterium OttesenSCG-928-L11]|nr:hypothetical protein [Ruminococcaceae bacterium OttesenSCG-928-L11]
MKRLISDVMLQTGGECTMVDQDNMQDSRKKESFVVQIQFNQNATWQGTLTWIEKKKVQRFRSTLEMLKLMDTAIGSDPDADDEEAVWK